VFNRRRGKFNRRRGKQAATASSANRCNARVLFTDHYLYEPSAGAELDVAIALCVGAELDVVVVLNALATLDALMGLDIAIALFAVMGLHGVTVLNVVAVLL
jgi:hypothetical protein